MILAARQSERGREMKRLPFFFLCTVSAVIVSCGTTNSADLYDPNAAVAAITISTSGSIDASNRSIALPPGGDDLSVALRNAFSGDGWAVSTSTTDTHYVMLLQTKVWTYQEKLSNIDLSIVDQRTGAEILKGVRKTYSPDDPAIDVKAVAEAVISALKKVTVQSPDNANHSQ